MTNHQWHATQPMLAHFATDAAGMDEATAVSVEAHLVVCDRCRLELRALADPALVADSWAALADRIDRARVPVAERAAHRLGASSGSTKLLAATAGLKAASLAAIALIAAAATVLSRTVGTEGPFLAIAPLVPLAAVALSFAPVAEPAGEVAIGTPLNEVGLIMRRTAAIVGLSFLLLGVAATALPNLDAGGAAWVLPALALSLGTLALGTWMRIETAVALLGGGWIATVGSIWWLSLQHQVAFPSPSSSSATQLTALAVAAISAAVVAARRDRFATLEVFR